MHPENRVELDRFDRLDHAALACGLLRSNNIPCEVSSTLLPGLTTDLVLWVNANDAKSVSRCFISFDGAARLQS